MIEVKQNQKPYLIGVTLLIAVAFSITIFALSTVSQPIGADYFYHLEIAKLLASGNFAGAWNYSLTNIMFPYSFMLFHLGLSLTVLSGNPFLIGRILESLLMPITFSLTMFLMVKKANAKAAFITGTVLLGSLAFVDGALQLRPESLDLLLYPIMIYAVLTLRKKSFVAMAVATVYSHSLAALSNVYGIAFKLLKEKTWRKTIVAGLIAILPVLIVSALYIKGAFKMWFTLAGANNSNPQQTLFWTHPLTFIPVYSGLTLIGFAFLFNRHKSYFESVLSWGIVGSVIMLPFWADRWLQYISIPLACLIGLRWKDASTTKTIIIVMVLTLIAAIYVSYWWMISGSHQWWQPGN